MKLKLAILSMWLFAIMGMQSCQKEDFQLTDQNPSELQAKKHSNNGKGKDNGKGHNKDDSTNVEDPFVVTYQVSQVDDEDPLYRFSISESGKYILLESDSTVDSWGTDYFGQWADPFRFKNYEVSYTVYEGIGLITTTYQFELQASGNYDVYKTVLIRPVLGGTGTTTETHPGIYTIVNN